ncbi:MAG: branched-chain amino acid ABC transporter permease [Deltaproteobacteria bacterium]|nr:branched-chain amino acid ABC transporter permease [Deltaproteobacteria bacterium]
MELLPQVIIDGILIGGVYITIAIGFSLVFGVMHIIDFAVGEWIMLGAFLGYYLNQWIGLDPFLLLPFIFMVFFGLGYVLQPAIQHVLSGHRGNPLLMGLVFTFGLMLAIRGLGLTIFGFYSRSIPSALSTSSFIFEKGNFFLTIPFIRLAGLLFAVTVTLILYYMLKKTDFGTGVRALAQHRESAGLMGVNAKRTNCYVFGIYVGISALTGVLIGCIFSMTAMEGGRYTVLAFFIVGLAGMGDLPGVPWAAVFLGLVQSFFIVYLSASYTLLAVFATLYVILLLSPKGLFGKGW